MCHEEEAYLKNMLDIGEDTNTFHLSWNSLDLSLLYISKMFLWSMILDPNIFFSFLVLSKQEKNLCTLGTEMFYPGSLFME